MPGMKKYQEGGRVRAGNPGMTSAEKSRRRESMSRLEDKIRREEEDAQSMAIAERATGGRYQDPPMPRRAEAADLTAGDAAAGNPRGVSLLQHFMGPMRSGRIRGEDPRPGGDFSIGRERNKAYARADQAAMQEDVDREVRRRMSKEPAFKKGGMVKKAAPAPVKKKAGGVVKKAKGGMIGRGCK